MQIIVAEFSTEYMLGEKDAEYFECSEWGFKKALSWCESKLPYDEDHTPRFWKNYTRVFTPEQIQKWTAEFIKDNFIKIHGFQYYSDFTISVVDVISKEDKDE